MQTKGAFARPVAKGKPQTVRRRWPFIDPLLRSQAEGSWNRAGLTSVRPRLETWLLVNKVIRKATGGGPVAVLPFRPHFGSRRSLLGCPALAPGIGLSLRSAYHDTTGVSRTWTRFPCFAGVRCSRVGCPLYPGGDGVLTAVEASSAVVCRLSAAGLLSLRRYNPTRGVCRNEASARGRFMRSWQHTLFWTVIC